MIKLTLNLSDIDSKEMLHDKLAEVLQFPEYYGRNLDALHDLLTDIHEDTYLKLIGIDELRESIGSYADGFLSVVIDSEEENEHFAFRI